MHEANTRALSSCACRLISRQGCREACASGPVHDSSGSVNMPSVQTQPVSILSSQGNLLPASKAEHSSRNTATAVIANKATMVAANCTCD